MLTNRVKKGGLAKSVVSDEMSDIGNDEKTAGSLVGATSDATTADEAVRKRRKVGAHRKYLESGDDEVEVMVSAVSDNSDVVRNRKSTKSKLKKTEEKRDGGFIAEMNTIADSLSELALHESIDRGLARKFQKQILGFQRLVSRLIEENAHLKGEIKGVRYALSSHAAVSTMPSGNAKIATPASENLNAGGSGCAPIIPKPVETWSVIVKGKQGDIPGDVVGKVRKEVGPTLGVRVHAIKPIKSGGAVIRTPSVAERQKIVANEKFAEVGLEVSVKDKVGPRIVVQKVDSEISSEEFIEELYEKNLRICMNRSKFESSVVLVTKPWKADSSGTRDVVLEVTNQAFDCLIGGVYIKWLRFNVRAQNQIRSCYRCLGFDHQIKDCRFVENVCHRCGLIGHVASRCQNPAHCRNCEFKGLPAGHAMLSAACPIVAAKIAVVNSRH